MRVLLFLPLLLTACSAHPDDSKPLQHQDHNDAAARAELADARAEQEENFEERLQVRAPTLVLTGVDLGPEEPRVTDVLKAKAHLRPGHSAFAEIDYTWKVNGREVLGVTAPTLDVKRGRFKKFDRIQVVATASDETGAMVQMASGELLIANATPSIVTDISGKRGLNGLHLKAEDPDGDPLIWSILSGPPGITVDRRGRLRVEQRDMKEDYKGEVVVAVEDPDGARAELHVPVAVNAAKAKEQVEEEVTKHRGRMDGTMDDYVKAQEDAVKAIDKMTPAEFDKYMADQEKNALK